MSQPALRVKGINYLIDVNSKLHHTSEFVTPDLVVRRGQPFTIRLDLNRELFPQDKVVLQLSLKLQAQKLQDMTLHLTMGPGADPRDWGATVVHKVQHQCDVKVWTPAKANVGQYFLSVETEDNVTSKLEKRFFYLLFNPWCEDDEVFLSDEIALQEYVMNDTGYIYVGHASDITAMPWNFGQFEQHVLEVCMELLAKAELQLSARGEPVRVARAMSALVNSNDDKGILVGSWSGTYPCGTHPGEWTGSSAILQNFRQTSMPVRYGQCWVFSGVLTTVMRAIGIPCRSITNFTSAHDTGGNVTVDVYINENGERLSDVTKDSIWNFHVWNDVWMKRPDLPQGYDGWQALDSTPQEKSQGIFQCGPAPLYAIKSGEIKVPHDTKFVFAEVNADVVTWKVEKSGSGPEKISKLKVQPSMVGRNISTKAPGKDTREDITLQYKFPEGSTEERRVMDAAKGGCVLDVPMQEPQYATLDILSESSTSLGAPITLSLSVKSEAPEPLSLTLMVAVQLQAYNGKTISTVKTLREKFTLSPGTCTVVPMKTEVTEYLSCVSQLSDNLLVRVTAIVESNKPHFICTEDAIITFQWPHITVDIPSQGSLGKPFTCTFTFKNNTGVTMENCKLQVEGLGLFKLTTFNKGDVGVGMIFRSKVICIPIRTGRRKIIARVTSNQISGITAEGFINIS
ncbi:protein-glutamine gamma-glutamyltransferase 4-like [Scleropages formosus]|uniref:Transglutaminase 4 n=1 Tax=Scleropages formosus TaxID=113540 RepID=A0A8C9SKL7_SCLFO|nr:protein-glutamine gamma-glutamyltransferase 4 [Scleropages formosus]